MALRDKHIRLIVACPEMKPIPPNSLRRRYLYVALLLGALLLGTGLVGQLFVRQTTDEQQQRTQMRLDATQAVQGLSQRFFMFETTLQQFLLLPEQQQHTALVKAYADLHSAVAQIPNSAWLKHFPALHSELKQLDQVDHHLGKLLTQIVNIRLDAETTFPFTTAMLELASINERLFGAVDLALNEIDTQEATPQRLEARRVFADLRYRWSQAVSEFRLLVDVRLGIFSGDLGAALQIRTKNMQTQLDSTASFLERLVQLENAGALDFQASESLSQIRELRALGDNQFQKGVAALHADGWRVDLPMFREAIMPQQALALKALRNLQQSLDDAWAESTLDLSHDAQRLSYALTFLALGGLVIIGLGYLLVDRALLKPIAQVAVALKREAQGTNSPLALDTSSQETQDLVEAFNDMRAQVNMRQQRLENILDHAAEAIITLDADCKIETFNNAAQALFGYAEDEMANHHFSQLFPTQCGNRCMLNNLMEEWRRLGGKEIEWEGQHKDGTHITLSLKLSETVFQGRQHFTVLVTDITERKVLLARLQQMAEQDALTGLPNRALLRNRLEDSIHRAGRHNTLLALLFLDLDGFKQVNDSLGHEVGDRLLQAVAERLSRCMRKSDTIARLGGDEFTIIVEELDQADQAALICQNVLDTLTAPFHIHGQDLHIGCSIGIAVYPLDDKTVDALIRDADTAMYAAKKLGGNTYQYFSLEMFNRVADHHALQSQLRCALEQEAFVVYYQPIYDLTAQCITGAEALLRWRHPQRGLILPDEFIPVLEETGLIVPVTAWVLDQMGRDFPTLQGASPRPFSLAINLTPRCFGAADMVDKTLTQLQQSGLPPECLILEITESVLEHSTERAAAMLQAFKRQGLRIALDDFGTGYSSLSRLKRFPIDILKIDRSFVRDMFTDQSDAELVSAIISMARRLHLRVVAEGVETDAQLAFLRKEHCDAVQGYLINKPVSVATLAVQLRESGGHIELPASPASGATISFLDRGYVGDIE